MSMEDNRGSGNPPTRRRFLRQLGVTVLAAVGAGALAQSAFAVNNCCPSDQCGTCQANGIPGKFCFCNCSGVGTTSYCTNDCVTGSCISCPC
jgi:hypothetical protein